MPLRRLPIFTFPATDITRSSSNSCTIRSSAAGSTTQSASMVTMISPLARSRPVLRARDLPALSWRCSTRWRPSSRRQRCASRHSLSHVPSVDPSSTTTTSTSEYVLVRIDFTVDSIPTSSFQAGTMTLTRGLAGAGSRRSRRRRRRAMTGSYQGATNNWRA